MYFLYFYGLILISTLLKFIVHCPCFHRLKINVHKLCKRGVNFLSRKTLYHYTMLVVLRATIHDPFLLLEHGTLLPHLFLEHSGMTRTLQWRCFPQRPWTGRILCSTFDDLNRQSNRYICCINRIIRNSKPKIDPNPSQLLHRPAYWTVFVVQRGYRPLNDQKYADIEM